MIKEEELFQKTKEFGTEEGITRHYVKKEGEKEMEKGNYTKINGILGMEDDDCTQNLKEDYAWSQNFKRSETIPVENVMVDDLMFQIPQMSMIFWDQIDLDDNTPIILEKRENVILAGHYRLYKAIKAGEKEITAVYIDSLKDISLRAILEQFKDKKLAYSFAYNLYASTSYGEKDLISFSNFCDQIESIFINTDFNARIADFIGFLDYVIGGHNNGK